MPVRMKLSQSKQADLLFTASLLMLFKETNLSMVRALAYLTANKSNVPPYI